MGFTMTHKMRLKTAPTILRGLSSVGDVRKPRQHRRWCALPTNSDKMTHIMPYVFFMRHIVSPKNMPNCHVPPQIYAYLALLWIGTKIATVIDIIDRDVSKTAQDNVKQYRGTAASNLIFCQTQGGIHQDGTCTPWR